MSYYNITSDFNRITFGDNNATRYASLKPGTYSGTQLAEQLSTALTQGGTQTYTATFDAISGKLTVSASGQFKFTTNGTTAAKILGLKNDSIPATTYTFDNPIDLTGTQLVLVSVPEISASGAVIYAGRQTENVLDAVPITSDIGTVLVHENRQPEYLDINDMVLSEVTVILKDSNTLKPLDLHGESFQIIFDII